MVPKQESLMLRGFTWVSVSTGPVMRWCVSAVGRSSLFKVDLERVCILALWLNGFVTLGKLLNLSKLPIFLPSK